MQAANNVRAAIALYAGVGIAMLWPAFGPGQLFLHDMSWPEQLNVSSYAHHGITASLPLLCVLRLLNYVIPAGLLQKLLLLSLLTLCGVGMYALQKKLSAAQGFFAVLAGLIYMLNPYAIDRLAAGQWMVLAGYACLPIFAWFMYDAFTAPSRHNVLRVLAAWAIYPVISMHWWYIVTLFSVPAVLYLLARGHGKRRGASTLAIHVQRDAVVAPWLYVVLPAVGICWLLFLSIHYGGVTGVIDSHDFTAFATRPAELLGAWGSVLSLRGFWYNPLSDIPSALAPLWFVVCAGLLALTYRTLLALHRRHPSRATYAAWVFIGAVLLAVGYGSSLGRWIVDIYRAVVPGFNGLRDTQKIVGLIAFIYALAAPYALQQAWDVRASRKHITYLVPAFVGAYMLCMLVAIGALHYTVTPHRYPADWQAVNSTFYYHQPKRVLILPWNGYIHLPFAGNALVANPAATYFAAAADTRQNNGIAALDAAHGLSSFDRSVLSLRTSPNALTDVRAHGYDYIVLLKTEDYARYKQQLDDAGLELLSNGSSLYLYRTKQQLVNQSF